MAAGLTSRRSASSAAVSASSSAAMSVTRTRDGIRGKPQSVKSQRELLDEGPHLLLVALRHGSSISLLHNIHNLVKRA